MPTPLPLTRRATGRSTGRHNRGADGARRPVCERYGHPSTGHHPVTRAVEAIPSHPAQSPNLQSPNLWRHMMNRWLPEDR